MIAILLATALTVQVPEKPGGRTINLNVSVVESKQQHDDAIFVIAGGPGVPATGMAGFAPRTFAGSERDIVLIDARGTGKSNPLHCDLGGSDKDLQGYFNDFLPLDKVTECRDKLAKRADLTQYTTSRIVDDLEAVRKKLRYKQVDLYGTSYGTRVAIEYMRRYPKNVRAAILDGVVPPSLHTSETFAADAQSSLNRVIDLCLSDANCRGNFDHLREDYTTLMNATKGGVDLTLQGQAVHINRGYFGEMLRNFLYSREVYVKLPQAISNSARGNWNLFSDTALSYARAIRGLDVGLFLTVSCTEDIPSMDIVKARQSAKDTFLGVYRINQQYEACKVWPHGSAVDNATIHEPLVSSIPTLLISGELDPATPPRFGDEVAKGLKNSLHAIIQYGSHSGDTGGCQEKVMSEFVREGSVASLETACFQQQKKPSFGGE
jgi:pimeloyl-ACP methyl ester carboxylesterase